MLCCANLATYRQWSPSGTTPSSHPFATGYWPEARPMQVVVAAMRRLLQLAFGVLKSGQPFDPNFGLA